MTLLDRFRGQPEWQHEDPLVRTSAVDELEDDAQDLLTALASEDADPGVRAAAVVRLSDPEILGRIVRTDQDGGVRAEAVAMLRMMAVDDTDAERAAGALAGLSEARDLGEVARTARLEAISGSALERLDGQKTISAVARRSAHPAIRRAAARRRCPDPEAGSHTFRPRSAVSFSSLVMRPSNRSSITGTRALLISSLTNSGGV